MTCSTNTGATQGGAITQIVARGAADYNLTGGAMITYWRLKHSTHTNFATEPIQQAFTNTVAFGGPTASITLNRTGDLIHRQYVVIDLPGITPVVDASSATTYAYVLDTLAADADGGDYLPEPEVDAQLVNPLGGFYCHWTNAVGYALLSAVRLIVGGHVIDTLYSDYLYMFEELSGKAGKRMQDMIGKFETREQLIAYSSRPQRLYVPLPFWYCQVAGNALSLVSLAFHGVTLAVDFASLDDLIIVSNQDIVVYKTTEAGVPTTRLLSETDLTACIQTEYVYLDVSERNRFAEGLFDQLIHTVQAMTTTHSNGATISMNLLFNHPVMELIFACRLKANEDANRWFDYSRVGPAAGSGGSTDTFPTAVPMQPQTEGTFDALGDARLIADNGMYNIANVVTVNADPIVCVGLRVNNLQRFSPMEGQYFRQVQPYQHHTNIPKGFIYNYSFALHPEEPNPSGSLNWSRLDSVILELTLHADIVGYNVTMMVYARNWNVFSYVDGIGGAKFQS